MLDEAGKVLLDQAGESITLALAGYLFYIVAPSDCNTEGMRSGQTSCLDFE